MNLTERLAYMEGQLARTQRRPVEANPYDEASAQGCALRLQWVHGWRDADTWANLLNERKRHAL